MLNRLLAALYAVAGLASPALAADVTMNAGSWSFLYGSNMPAHPNAAAFSFTFPTTGAEVDYLLTPINRAASVSIVVVSRTDILSGHPVFQDHDTGPCFSPTMATIMIQRQGDNMIAEDGRWWAEGARIPLDHFGAYITTVASLTNLHTWRNVQGHYANDRPSQFAYAIAHIGNIGLTYGGCAFGHGAWTYGGSAREWINRMTAQ